MSLSKYDITKAINQRRLRLLSVVVSHLQRLAVEHDWFYEGYWNVPPTQVPPHVYRNWFSSLLYLPKDPRVVGNPTIKLPGKAQDHTWLLDQLLE